MGNIIDTNDFQDSVSGVENITKKGKGKVVAAVSGVAVAAVVGGGIAAYNFSDFVKNQVKLRIMKPADYYAWVNEENSSEIAKKAGENYRKSLDQLENGSKATFSLTYEPSSDVKDLLIDETGLNNADDEDSKMVLDMINSITSIGIGSSAEVKKSNISGNVFANVNNERLVTFDYAMEEAAMNYFMRVPELTEKWLCVNIEDMGDDVMDTEAQEILEAYQKAMENPQEFLSPEELETLVKRYSDIWIRTLSDVSLEKKEAVDICDITVDYTVVSTELTGEKVLEICKNYIEEVKNDDIIKGIVVDKLDACDSDEYTQAFDEALEAIEGDVDFEGDETVTLETYIDPKGIIRGYNLDAGEQGYLKLAMGMAGDEVRAEFVFNDEGEDEAVAELKASKNGTAYDGNFDMTVDDETVTVDFTGFEVVNPEYGYFNGKFEINIPDVDTIVIDCNSDGSAVDISTDVKIEDINIGKFTLSISAGNGADPIVPDKENAVVVDSESDDFLSEYTTQEEVEKFLNDILVKIGLSDNLSSELAKLGAEEAFSEGFSYEDDDYDFDFDEEDEDEDEDEEIDFDGFLEDEYEADCVEALEGQAYLTVADKEFMAYYMGGGYETLSYKATVADIKGDGTYTVGVTADTDGYKNMCDDKPNGLYMLAVSCSNPEISEDAEITVKSIKIDGKEIELTGEGETEITEDEFGITLYLEDVDYLSMIDASSLGEWTNIEVTFEIKNA